MRNCFVSYRGPAASRAGLAFVGQCKQAASASSLPPRVIRFQYNIFQSYVLEFGDFYMRVATNGAYVTETPLAITAATKANPCQFTVPGHAYANGDWVFVVNVGGMTQLNGRTFIVQNSNTGAGTFTLTDTFGNPINSINYNTYTSGGTSAKYFQVVSPYAVEDLAWLKFVQSADVMTLTCVNQTTGTEYPPYDLERLAANDWNFDLTTFASAIAAPATCTAAATVTASPATQYAFCVTAVDAATGQESIASPIAYVTDSVDIAVTAGSLIITWATVPGADHYNIYMAPPSYDTPVPVGSSFGYIGFSYGNQFVNTNIVPDFATTPPTHIDPFARSSVIGATAVSGGSSYVQASTEATMVGTATGVVLAPVVVSGVVVAIIIVNPGEGASPSDTISITDSGGGSGAIFTPVFGPATGTYPGVANYFQQRRVYADTLNNPDTEFFSQTGAYTNFDSGNPPIDSDAITLTPWGQQVNGVQWLQPMPGGLITATGQDAWQVSGTQGPGSPLTPSQESAQPQESNGFSPTVPPLKINYDILYVQSLGNIVRDLQYNFFTNIYAGTDISVLSNHMFDNYQIVQWAWAKEPYKVVWATRNDGKFLSLTYLKEQELIAWARHDTNGLVVGNTVATEPPVDAPYFVVKRFIVGEGQWAYFLERMDNRLWEGPESPWCVDCGLALPQGTPNATLSAATAEGPGSISGGYIAEGGSGYTDPGAEIVDPAGTGSGGAIVLQVTDGVITGFTFTAGQNYSPGTFVNIVDATGVGAVLLLLISQNVLFQASAPVFGSNNPGDVIRIGGGQAVVSQIVSTSSLLAAIMVPIKQTIPNDPHNLPVPAPPGMWTITTPVVTVTNLNHLEGMEVTGLADGVVIPPTVVSDGTIALPQPASAITIGLPYIAQLQAMYVEIQPTVQGKRKRVTAATVRMQASRGVQVGADQPAASTLDFQQEIPWQNMQDIPDLAAVNIPAAALPLFTGDRRSQVAGDWANYNGWEAAPGFVAVQQVYPLPMNILALIPDLEFGDSNG